MKRELFTLLDAPGIGATLTEGYAMLPTAAVSGFASATPTAATLAWAKSVVGNQGERGLPDVGRLSTGQWVGNG